jgi:hypothetical protein
VEEEGRQEQQKAVPKRKEKVAAGLEEEDTNLRWFEEKDRIMVDLMQQKWGIGEEHELEGKMETKKGTMMEDTPVEEPEYIPLVPGTAIKAMKSLLSGTSPPLMLLIWPWMVLAPMYRFRDASGEWFGKLVQHAEVRGEDASTGFLVFRNLGTLI